MKTLVISIVEAKYIDPYSLSITFSDGHNNVISFNNFLKSSTNPQIKKYLDKDLFKKFTIEGGDLHWNNYELSFHLEEYYSLTEIN